MLGTDPVTTTRFKNIHFHGSFFKRNERPERENIAENEFFKNVKHLNPYEVWGGFAFASPPYYTSIKGLPIYYNPD